jgi:putative ABC transport system permease protein
VAATAPVATPHPDPSPQGGKENGGLRFLLASLALQNLGRRKARSLLLFIAVAICAGSVFTGAVLMLSIQRSMDMGFTRLGADMLVLPEGTLNNITAALLTAEPTDLTLDSAIASRLARVKGVGQVAPQLIFRTDAAETTHQQSVDLIAFDPARDFTIQPWLAERLNRPFSQGDVIIGGRRQERVGDELLVFGQPLTVYGKLGRTAVGVHENGLFMSFSTLDGLRDIMLKVCGQKAPLQPGKLSGVLIDLAPGATTQQVRFAILANFPGVKVVAGESTLISIRQGLAVLLDGILALMGLMFISTATMVSLLFSAIITERRRELGLLKAIGARPRQIIGMLLIEAVGATAVGGAAGCLLGLLLMRAFEHSLVYYLEGIGIPFTWLGASMTALFALICILLASLIGAVGAFFPAWQASRREPYDLIRSEG